MADKDKASKLLALRILHNRDDPRVQIVLTLASMMAGAFCIGASQNLMAPSLTRIAHSFGLDDKQRDVVLGGWMSTAFFIVGAPASMLVGILADRVNRKQLFLLLLAAAAAVIGATGLAWSVPQLLVLRVALGAIYGGLNPILLSVVGDMVAPAARPAMSSYTTLAIGGGTAIGQLVAGALAGTVGWRVPYFFIAAGCAVSLGLVWSLAIEPARGYADRVAAVSAGNGSNSASGSGEAAAAGNAGEASAQQAAASGSSSGGGSGSAASVAPTSAGAAPPAASGSAPAGAASASTLALSSASSSDKALTLHDLKHELGASLSSLRQQLRRVLAVPTNALIFSQALFGTIPWSVITVFLPDYLAQEAGFTVKQATTLVMVFGIGAAVGGVLGGSVLGARLYRTRGPAAVSTSFGALQACSALPMLYIINAMMPVPVDTASSGGADDASAGAFHATLDSPGDGKEAAAAALAVAGVAAAAGSTSGGPGVVIYAVAAIAGLVASLTGPNLKAMLLNVNAPQTRGSVFTFAYIADSISKGLAPYILGTIIAGTGAPRSVVFSVAMLGWVVSGALIACTSRSVVADSAAAQAKAAASGGSSGGTGGSAAGVSTAAGR